MCYFSSRFIISPWSSPPPRPLVLNSSAPDLICLMLFWPLLVSARSQCDQRTINERGRDLPGYRRNRIEFFRGTWDERWKISSQKKKKIQHCRPFKTSKPPPKNIASNETHRSPSESRPSLPLRFGARWPCRCTFRRPPVSPLSAAGCCCC